MNNLQIISGVKCYEENGTAYLRLEDVARGLGFTDSSKNGEYVRWARVDKLLGDIGFATSGERPDYIPENIFYRLAMKAKNETAEKFQALVADEIIPSIRRTGGYIAGQKDLSPDELITKALLIAQKTIESQANQISQLQSQNQDLAQKAAYFDDLVDQNTLTTIRETANELNIGQKEFIDFLIENKFAYRKNNGQLRPRVGKSNGLLELKEVRSPRSWWKGLQVFVTPKGRETFRLLCKDLVSKKSKQPSHSGEIKFPCDDNAVTNVTAVAAILNINRLKFFEELVNSGMIIKTQNGYVPDLEYVENGYFVQSEYHDSNTGKVTYSVKITKLGFDFLVEKFHRVKI